MSYNTVVSTNDFDLDDDRILSWNMSEEGLTVPLMWNHNTSDVPVGSIKVWAEKDAATGYLVVRGSLDTFPTERGDTVKQGIEDGSINAVSVGAWSENVRPNSLGGWDILDANLDEVSAVIRPANSSALIERSLDTTKSKDGHKKMIIKGYIDLDTNKTSSKEAGKQDAETKEAGASKVDTPAKTETTVNTSATSETTKTGAEDAQASEEQDATVETLKSLNAAVAELQKQLSKPSVEKPDATQVDVEKSNQDNDAFVGAKRANASTKEASTENKEPNKMVQYNVMKKMAENINNRIAANADGSVKLSSVINKAREELNVKKSVEGADSVFPAPTDYGIIADYQDQPTLLETAPVHPTATLKAIVFDTDDEQADALSRANGDEEKIESILTLQSRVTNPGEVYSYTQLNYADLKQDVNGRLIPFLVSTIDRKVREGAEKQALVGNPSFKKNNISIDTQIRPIAKDEELFTAQTSASELNIANIDTSLAKIKAPGKVIMYANRSTYSKLKGEKATDGHYLLADSTMSKLSDHFDGTELRTVEYLADGEVIAFVSGAYEFASLSSGALDYFENYVINFNKKQFEKVTLLAGALTHFNSAVHFVVDPNAPASL